METMTKEQYTRIRKDNAITKACMPVLKRHIEGSNYGIFEHSSGQRISTVSERYCLVHNEQLLRPFVNQFGIDNMTNLVQYGNGRYLFASFETGRQFDMGNGDIINERIILQNSYDKTKSFNFGLGAFRRVCVNQLFNSQSLISYRKIHVGVIPVTELVCEALSNYTTNQFSFWKA